MVVMLGVYGCNARCLACSSCCCACSLASSACIVREWVLMHTQARARTHTHTHTHTHTPPSCARASSRAESRGLEGGGGGGLHLTPQRQRRAVLEAHEQPLLNGAVPAKQVTRHTSRVTRHTSHVTRHTSHVTHALRRCLSQRAAAGGQRLSRRPMAVNCFEIEGEGQGVDEGEDV